MVSITFSQKKAFISLTYFSVNTIFSSKVICDIYDFPPPPFLKFFKFFLLICLKFQSGQDISAYTYERTLMMEQRTQMLRNMRVKKIEVFQSCAIFFAQ